MNRLYTFSSNAKPKEICFEAARLLEGCFVTPGVVDALRKMKPPRQVEAAEHIVAGGKFSVTFAKGLLEITPMELRSVNPGNHLHRGSPALIRFLQQQASPLVRKLNRFKDSHGQDMLTLTVCCKYVERLLASDRVAEHLSRFHAHALRSLRSVLWKVSLAAAVRRRGIKLKMAR